MVIPIFAAVFAVLAALFSVSAHAADGEELRLSPQEKQFIESHPVIRVRLNAQIPPFLHQDQETPVGMAVDVLALAAAKLGIEIVPVMDMTFPDVLKRLPTGDGIDVQPLMRATPERAESLNFTLPYMDFPLVAAARTDLKGVAGLTDLAGKTVVVERGYWYGDEIRKKHPEIKLLYVENTGDAMAAVAAGHADAYVGVLPTATWHIETHGYSNLHIVSPVDDLTPASFSMAVRKDWPELASALNAALASISVEDMRRIRRRWLAPVYEYGISRADAVMWGGAAFMTAILLIGGFAVANRRLAREIGLRKAAEDMLRASDATSRELLNASSDACMLFDADGTMRGCNKVFAQRFNAAPTDVIGKSLWDFFPPDLAEQRRAAVQKVAESGEPEVTVDIRNGRHLSNTIYPLKDDSGVVRRIAVYSRDITDQINAEIRIKEYVAEIEQSNQDLEQFAYVASHDLREPLRQVAGFVSLLDRKYGPNLDDDARQFIAFARDGAMRMDRLVLDLLEFSRIGRNRSAAALDGAEILRAALVNLAARIDETGAKIETPPDMPMVFGAGPEVQSLFQNLIGNALKYCRPGVPPEIIVSCETIDGMAQFSVADNGMGIESEYFERIFGIFQRLDKNSGIEGTGIGLALCRRVVEKHGGRIWLDSTPGQGSTFHFTLPKV